jgi:Domain of Unknown Function with PDB structure (DUF3857)/Transglutaminase-like superfamily
MNNKWCLRLPYPRGTIRLLVCLAILGAASANHKIVLAGTPDWLRAAAQTPLPKNPEDINAVLLLDEQTTTVSDNGDIKTVFRRAYKIFRPGGRQFGKVVVSFDMETRLTYLKGWSIPAQGKDYEVKEKDSIETSLFSESLYDDTRYKILEIPAADPGNVIGYEYEQKRRPSIFQDMWWFQQEIPVRLARFTLRLPSGWEFRPYWLNHPAERPKVEEGNQIVWELADVSPIESEPSMPDWRAVAGRMGVVYIGPGAGTGGKSLASWQDVGAWYARLAEGRQKVTPEMKKKTDELTGGKNTPLEKIRALSAFVQKDIRYVAIEIGIGGYQPHSAEDVFTNRYGDCKDKVTLLKALLAEGGIQSNYVLINASRGVVAPDFPTMLEFNHVILAIPLLAPDGSEKLYAVEDDPKLGNILFFDPTDPSTPMGYLPPSLQANYGLLVTADGGQLVKLPLIAPTLNRLLRQAKLTLTPNGGIYGDVDELRWGYPADELRARLMSVPEVERAKYIERFIGTFIGGFSLESSQVENLDKPDRALMLHYRFEAGDYAKTAGNLLLVRPRVMGSKSDDVMEVTSGSTPKERIFPVVFPVASLESDVFEISLPPGYTVDELPPAVSIESGTATYKSKVEMDGNVMRYIRNYQVNDVLVTTDHLSDLKKFYRQVSADESNSAVPKQIQPQ